MDLGTTNSSVAVTQDGATFVVPGPDGTQVTRSVVSYDEHGGVTVGQSAELLSVISKASSFSSVKRLIGRRVTELDRRMYELLPYYIMNSGESDFAALSCPSTERVLRPEEVSAEVLRALKAAAERHVGEEVSEVVLSVPAYFGPGERDATEEAARLAGLDVLR